MPPTPVLSSPERTASRSVPSSLIEGVRARLRADAVDPTRDPQTAAAVAGVEIRRFNDAALARGAATIDDESAALREIVAAVSGYGALQSLLDDPEVEEIWINAPDRVFIARAGVSQRIRLRLTEVEIRDLVERMLHASGRRVDLSQPFVDASLPDGSRLHVTIPNVARHWTVNIRKFLRTHRDLPGLVAAGALPDAVAGTLVDALAAGQSLLVSGATHAGKTTLLSALMSALPAAQRIVSVEETFELGIDATDVVALQGRQPSLEGSGEITLRRLVKEALRMRPDRLVVGEVRDAEALDLLLALNTGVPGAASIHANSGIEALAKFEMLPLLAGRNIDHGFVQPAIARCVHLVVHCARSASGARRVASVDATTGRIVDGRVETRPVYRAAT